MSAYGVRDQILEQKTLPVSYHLEDYQGFRDFVPGAGGRHESHFFLPSHNIYLVSRGQDCVSYHDVPRPQCSSWPAAGA